MINSMIDHRYDEDARGFKAAVRILYALTNGRDLDPEDSRRLLQALTSYNPSTGTVSRPDQKPLDEALRWVGIAALDAEEDHRTASKLYGSDTRGRGNYIETYGRKAPWLDKGSKT